MEKGGEGRRGGRRDERGGKKIREKTRGGEKKGVVGRREKEWTGERKEGVEKKGVVGSGKGKQSEEWEGGGGGERKGERDTSSLLRQQRSSCLLVSPGPPVPGCRSLLSLLHLTSHPLQLLLH